MNKRGLSDVIVAVLLILLVVVAIAIIWVFISTFLTSTDSIDTNTLNTLLSIQPDSVNIDESGNLSFNVKMDLGEKVDRVQVIITNEEGNTATVYRNITFQRLEVKHFFIPFTEHLLGNITKIEIAPMIETKTGMQFGVIRTQYYVNQSTIAHVSLPVIPLSCQDGICSSEIGENCSSCPTDCMGCPGVCGDGAISSPEQCDNGGSNTNTVIDRTSLTYNTNSTTCSLACQNIFVRGPYCGEAIIDNSSTSIGGTEQCDNGTLNTNSAAARTSLTYNTNSTTCNLACQNIFVRGPYCGDGINDTTSGEQCDNGGSNTNTPGTPPYGTTLYYCNKLCRALSVGGAYCGDNIVSGTEQCDNGTANGIVPTGIPYGSSTVYCSATCQNATAFGLRCGDGIITNPPEVCDGTNVGSETCVSKGFLGGTLKCSSSSCTSFDTSLCLSIPTSGILGYWKLDRNLNDAFGRYNATIVTKSAEGSVIPISPGKVNDAYSFSALGTTDIPNLAGTYSGLTIVAWIYPTTGQLGSGVWRAVVQTNTPSDKGFHTYQNQLQMHDTNGADPSEDCNKYSSAILQENTWTHVVVTISSSNYVTYYINGVNAGGGQTTNCARLKNIDDLHISGNLETDNENWRGKLDEVGIWNRALSATEISSIYDAQKNG